jgi:hypothetical protein
MLPAMSVEAGSRALEFSRFHSLPSEEVYNDSVVPSYTALAYIFVFATTEEVLTILVLLPIVATILPAGFVEIRATALLEALLALEII